MTLTDAAIVSRLWMTAALARPLKRVVALETLVRLAHYHRRRRPRSAEYEARLEGWMGRTGRFPFRPPANCLERSLGAYRMLCVAGASPELVVGVRRVPGRGVEGHVWITLDGRPLAERADDLATYAVVATFDSLGRRTSPRAAASELAGLTLR